MSDLEQFEAESFDLGEDAEQSGLIFKPTGELVSLRISSHAIEGKTDSAVAPSRPLIRILYKLAGAATRSSCRPTE